MSKDVLISLLKDNDRLAIFVAACILTSIIVVPIAFTAGSRDTNIESRIAHVEGQVKVLNERYMSIAERGELPASIERRLSEIERALVRIENSLTVRTVLPKT